MGGLQKENSDHFYFLEYINPDVMQVQTVPLMSLERVTLVRVRNPWGNQVEWTGAWKDDSQEWNLVTQEEKELLGVTDIDDGEWWMDLKDFAKHFDQVELCHLPPNSRINESESCRWVVNSWNGSWVADTSAGGCR